MAWKDSVLSKFKQIKFVIENVVNPILTLIISVLMFAVGWYIQIFGQAPIGGAFWMIGLFGFYLTYKSFEKSSYF